MKVDWQHDAKYTFIISHFFNPDFIHVWISLWNSNLQKLPHYSDLHPAYMYVKKITSVDRRELDPNTICTRFCLLCRTHMTLASNSQSRRPADKTNAGCTTQFTKHSVHQLMAANVAAECVMSPELNLSICSGSQISWKCFCTTWTHKYN